MQFQKLDSFFILFSISKVTKICTSGDKPEFLNQLIYSSRFSTNFIKSESKYCNCPNVVLNYSNKCIELLFTAAFRFGQIEKEKFREATEKLPKSF